ncbi:MAG: histidine--tRNA ligase, partial [Fusobacterium sp.]|nr:histidine--tRNA ligase [Fusobacterium sp.]
MELIKAVRGTKDIIGEDAKKYMYISNVTQEMFENYGYNFAKT